MTPKAIKDVLKGKFNTDITGVTIQYDNESKDPPENSLWIRFTILPGESAKKSIGSPGSNITRHVGVAIAEIFTPFGTGDKDVYDKAEVIRAAFSAGTYSSVTVREPTVGNPGRSGSWNKLNITIPYFADELT